MSWVARLAAGLAASLAAHRWLPLPAEDPLRETLVWLPALVAGWVSLERTPGARRLPARLRDGQTLALGLLVLLALLRSRLALPYSEALAAPLIATGLVLLLAHRACHQLVHLRPLLGRRLPARPSPAFFLLPLLAYASLLPWASRQRPPDGDEPHYLLVTHSLAYDLDTDLANNYAAGDARAFVARPLEPQPGDPVGRAGERFSRHNMLLPLALAVPYRLFGLRGAQLLLCALAAALVWATLRLARHYCAARPGEALAATGVLAFTAPLLLFSHQVWAEVPAALLMVVGLDALITIAADPAGRRPWASAAVALVLLPLLKLRFTIVALGLLAVAVVRSPHRRAGLTLAAGGLLGLVAANLTFNALRFGNPLKYQEPASLVVYVRSLAGYGRGAVGLLWDCAFGLFASAPLWLVLLPALAWPRLRDRALLRDAALACGPYLLAVLPRGEWYGAWSPPFRYGVVAMPLLALLLAPVAADRRRGGPRVVLAALGLVTLALTVLWCVRPGWTYNLADGRTHLLDFLGATFGADFARCAPSALRPRAATWWWVVASLLLLPLAWGAGRKPARDRGRGALFVVVASGLFVLAATRLPTRVVELEDAWIEHVGGALYPERWVVGRLHFRGGWALPDQAVVSIPIVPGGRALTVILEARKLRPPATAPQVALRADETEVARVQLAEVNAWQSLTVGPVSWPPGARRLVLALPSVAFPRRRSGALIDRLRIAWSD